MSAAILPSFAPGPRRMFGPRRVIVALAAAGLQGLIISPAFTGNPTYEVVGRTMLIGLVALLAFGLFERWPARLPKWMARWVLQVLGVALAYPIGTLALYAAITHGDPVPFLENTSRLWGFGMITVSGVLFGPWVALAALYRRLDSAARSQALSFELERSELERNALDSRLRLLQAQVEPHFLFNTLANVRELVDTGSPQASKVLDNLIEYLRAAVPRLHEPATLGHELQLARAYLELMQMRMPDRLEFAVQADPAALRVSCPPTTLLTLVENAVRHGIDPGEKGGRIDVRVFVRDRHCTVQVCDTGVGFRATGGGLGTGLSALRERLRLLYGDDAQLRFTELEPHGVCAEVEFPMEDDRK
jgi:signal transduction histidine kinase